MRHVERVLRRSLAIPLDALGGPPREIQSFHELDREWRGVSGKLLCYWKLLPSPDGDTSLDRARRVAGTERAAAWTDEFMYRSRPRPGRKRGPCTHTGWCTDPPGKEAGAAVAERAVMLVSKLPAWSSLSFLATFASLAACSSGAADAGSSSAASTQVQLHGVYFANSAGAISKLEFVDDAHVDVSWTSCNKGSPCTSADTYTLQVSSGGETTLQILEPGGKTTALQLEALPGAVAQTQTRALDVLDLTSGTGSLVQAGSPLLSNFSAKLVDGCSQSFSQSSTIASIALANLGDTACGRNSVGGTSYQSSCTGNGGQPEYWCADFARWVWGQAGVDTGGLSAAAGSFYVYGQNHGTLHTSPLVGDAVVFDYAGGGYADHVAIVVQVNGDGTIETASGDWNGNGDGEAEFSSSSHVILNAPAYGSAVGTSPGVIGMTISGFISPAGTDVSCGGGSSSGGSSYGSCTSTSGKAGTCIDTSACGSMGGASDPANLCPGPDNIQCCTTGGASPPPSYGSCTSTAGKAGTCLDTSACGSMGGASDPADLCPGPDNIQCCTTGSSAPSCTNTAGKAGTCIDTSTCASQGGRSDPADLCPGPDNIQCCTH